MGKLLAAVAVAYALVGFWTHGHIYNRGCGVVSTTVSRNDGGATVTTKYVSCAPAPIAGAFWPIYWTGRLAVEVTRP